MYVFVYDNIHIFNNNFSSSLFSSKKIYKIERWQDETAEKGKKK